MFESTIDPDQANHATLMQGAERERARDLAARVAHHLSVAGFHNTGLAIIGAMRDTKTTDDALQAVTRHCSAEALASLPASVRGEIGLPPYAPPMVHVRRSMVHGCAAQEAHGAAQTGDTRLVTCPECAKAWAERPGQTVVVPSPKQAAWTDVSPFGDLPAVRVVGADYSSEPLSEMLGGEMAVTAGDDPSPCAPSQSEVARLTERCEVLDATIRNQAAAIRDRDFAIESARWSIEQLIARAEKAERERDAHANEIAPLANYLSSHPSRSDAPTHACVEALRLLKMRAEQDRIDRGVIDSLKSTIARQDALLDGGEMAALRDDVTMWRDLAIGVTAERDALKARAEKAERDRDAREKEIAALRSGVKHVRDCACVHPYADQCQAHGAAINGGPNAGGWMSDCACVCHPAAEASHQKATRVHPAPERVANCSACDVPFTPDQAKDAWLVCGIGCVHAACRPAALAMLRLTERHDRRIADRDAEVAALRDENNSLRQDYERLTTERITVKQEVDYHRLSADKWRSELEAESGAHTMARAAASAERRTSAADLVSALVAVSDWRTLSECWKRAAHGLAGDAAEAEQRADRAEWLAMARRRDADALSNQLANIAHDVGATASPDDAVRDLVSAVTEWRQSELHYRFVSDMPDPGGSGADAFDRLTAARKELMRVAESACGGDDGFKGILHGVAGRVRK